MAESTGVKQEAELLEDLIWKRQYAAGKDENFELGAVRVGEGVGTNPSDSRSYASLITSRRFIPGGRILAGAGSAHGNLLNCFVQDGAPFESGSTTGVLLLARKLALVTKVGGGNGVNLDPLPPKSNYEGPLGTAWLTIAEDHADHDKVRDGTHMDLVRGQYETRGYSNLRFTERDAAPAHASVIRIEDSVDGIWTGAADMVNALLSGEDVLVDLSALRAEGTPVHGSGGNSSGPGSFAVEIFDNFARWASLGGAEHAGPVATLRYIYAPTLRVIRQGGCLHPDTLVNTSRGTLRLGELVDQHQQGWQGHTLKVATDHGWKDSPEGFNNGVKPTLRVTLHNGQTLRGTHNHKLKVLREDGSREWVRFDELNPGDYVIQVLDQHTGAPVLLQPVDLPHHNAGAIKMPQVLDEELALFLGYLWGDGFVSSGRVGFSVAHGSPMVEEGKRLFRDLFGLEVSVEQKPGDASLVLVTKSAQLIEWLKRNGLEKGTARSLSIPKAIRMSPRPVVGAFLKGLFEADGSLTHGMPVLSTASVQLAEDVATMLAGLGIPSKRRTASGVKGRYSRHAIHSVRVTSHKGLERFIERIGHVEGSRLAAMGEHVPDEAREQSWLFPHAAHLLQPALAAMPAGARGRPSDFTQARKTVSRYIRGERQLTATGYERMRTDAQLHDELPEFDYEQYFVPVLSIEEAGPSLTLDISVDVNKTYLAGGFVTHNSRRGAGMATLSATHADLVDFITGKDLEREAAEGDISTFNISVLVTDEFMRRAHEQEGGRERQVLDKIARHAWQTGEPGVIFIDAINAHNPLAEIDGPIMATNPCVPADTWVMTSQGARQVRDLVGTSFKAVVDGKEYATVSDGFWSTGVKQLLRVKTASGHELRLTGNHRLKRVTKQTRHVQETEWVEAESLLPGDRIMLQNHRDVTPWQGNGTFEEGWLVGSLVGDGTLRTDRSEPEALLDYWGEEKGQLADAAVSALGSMGGERAGVSTGGAAIKTRIESPAVTQLASAYGITAGNKTITDQVEEASHDFYRGFLRGLFDADGSLQGSQEKGVSVRLVQSDPVMLHRAQRMLARLGVLSTVYEVRRPGGVSRLPDGRGGSRDHQVRAQHELVISNDNVQQFASLIGFESSAKQARLTQLLSRYGRTSNRERFSDEIVAIEADGTEEVFDVTVAEVHAFDANGITAHNCGEIPLYPGEPCDLGAINLAAHIKDGRLDTELLRSTARASVRFLDDVLTAEKAPLPEIHDAIHDKRRIGLGVMGLSDMLIRLGVRYDSDAGRAAVRQVIDIMRDAALSESASLAEERGVPAGVKRAGLERRNIAVFTVAPTGTTSMLAGVSGGVEPVFAATYTRRIGTDYVKVVHPLLEEILEELEPVGKYATSSGSWDHEAILADLDEHEGSLQPLLADLPSDPRLNAFVIAHDIAPRDHVLMQATVQRAFDWDSESDWRNRNEDGKTMAGNSISKTINLPNAAVVDDVLAAYELAWEEGCKGITVYRDGSRDLQVLTSGKQQAESKDRPAETPAAQPVQVQPTVTPTPVASTGHLKEYERESRMHGITDKVQLANSSGVSRGFFITVNSDSNGDPREVFILSGKGGDEANGDSEALGRVVSIALQYGVPASALVSTLRGISGGMFGTYQGRIITSKADLIAVALETASPNGAGHAAGQPQAVDGEGCPHCGAEMRMAEGCMTCTNMACGWSRCS